MADDAQKPQSAAPGSGDSSIARRIEFLDGLKQSVSTGRLGYDWKTRFALATMTTFGGGFVLGGAFGMRLASLRFLAENAHRMPTNKNGWYQYYRAKNRYRIWEGVKEGTKMGIRLTPWVLLFLGIEEVIDISRVELGKNNIDAAASTAAGLVSAGMYSLSARMPFPTTVRMLKLGLFAGAGYGLAQDFLASLQGKPPQYVASIKGFIHRFNSTSEDS